MGLDWTITFFIIFLQILAGLALLRAKLEPKFAVRILAALFLMNGGVSLVMGLPRDAAFWLASDGGLMTRAFRAFDAPTGWLLLAFLAARRDTLASRRVAIGLISVGIVLALLEFPFYRAMSDAEHWLRAIPLYVGLGVGGYLLAVGKPWERWVALALVARALYWGFAGVIQVARDGFGAEAHLYVNRWGLLALAALAILTTYRLLRRSDAPPTMVTLPVLLIGPGAALFETSVALSPASAKIAVGQTKAFSVAFADAYGNLVPTPTTVWTLTSSTILNLDAQTGVARGAKTGTTTIVVRDSAGRIEARATVEVLPVEEIVKAAQIAAPAPKLEAGEPFVFKVTILDENGQAVEGLRPVFRVEKPEHGVISSTGVFTGDKAGVTDVIATIGLVESRTTVTVIPGALAQIKISPESATLALGGSIAFRGEGQDSRRNPIPGVPITWSVGDATMGSITPEGAYTAGDALGANKVRASAGKVTRDAVVYQFIKETKAPAHQTTVVGAVTTSSTVANVDATTHVVGLAAVATDAKLDLALPPAAASQANTLREAKVAIERPATNVTIMLEIQPGSVDVLPEEIDRKAFEKRVSEASDPQPALFISVSATEDGERLNSARLNSLLHSLDVQFSIAASYFEQRDLDPTRVRLVEWSGGQIVRVDVPAKLLTPDPLDGVYTYSASLFQFSSFAFVAASRATPPPAPAPAALATSGAPHLSRIELVGPTEVVAGTVVQYDIVGWSSQGTRAQTLRSSVLTKHTTAGPATVAYAEWGVTALLPILVLPGPTVGIAVNAPKVAPVEKPLDLVVVAVDAFGNERHIETRRVLADQLGPATFQVEAEGFRTSHDVLVIPDVLARIDLVGPTKLFVGESVEYELFGYDPRGYPLPLQETKLLVKAPDAPGEIVVSYEERGVSTKLQVGVEERVLAEIRVLGSEVVAADTTITFLLEGYDAFGVRVPLDRDTLSFDTGSGSRDAFVCYSEANVSGCSKVRVDDPVEVTGVTAPTVRASSFPALAGGLLLALAVTVIILAARLRKKKDEGPK